MPVSLDVTSNIKQEISFLNRLQSGFQTAQREALNDTGFQLRRDLVKSLETDLDKPTPYTKRGISIQKATRNDLTTSVFVLPDQAEYLIRQVIPQTRQPFSEYIIVPTEGSRRNQYGNLTRAARRKLFNRSINNIYERGDTVYVRSKRSGQLLAVLVRRTRYTVRRWKFYEHAERSATRNFPFYLNRRLSTLERRIV